jgi:hypothetical protein
MGLWSKIPMLWQNAIKQAISAGSAVIITNLADPQTAMFSWPWFRHMLIGMFFLTLLNEARYWKQWADSPAQVYEAQSVQSTTDDSGAPVTVKKTVTITTNPPSEKKNGKV